MSLHSERVRPLSSVIMAPASRGPALAVIAVLLLCLTGLPASAQTPLDRSNSRSPIYEPPPEASPTPTVGWAPARDVVVRYELPGSGQVVQGFDRPTSTFGAGHRGIDLSLVPGAFVTAAAEGTVHHAGPVAGTVWVSILHADGIITSYGPLTDLTVRRGEGVRRGQRIGSLASGGHGHGDGDRGLHLGARRGVVYIDPLRLLDQGTPRPSLVGGGAWRGVAHVVTPYEPWEADRFAGLGLHPSPDADRPGFAVPPSPNHVILLNGLATSSGRMPVDPDHLGYDPRSVTLFSYAGRTDEPGDPADLRRDQRPYGPSDTWDGVEPAARRLAEQLRAQQAREPGRAVDLIGHSMGGVVVLHYLSHLHDPYDRTLPSIGRVVTIAAPHRGSDTAGATRFLREHPIVGPAIEAVRGRIDYADGSTERDRLPLDAPAIDQLRTGSRFIRDHGQAWVEAVDGGVAGPLAMGTQVLAIGGSRDVVVAPGNARSPTNPLQDHPTLEHRGPDADAPPVARHTVLPGGHSSVLDTEAVREVTWRFLAGQDVPEVRGGLSAIAADQFGPALHFGSAVSYLYGGVVPGLRRLSQSVTNLPIEPEGPLRDAGGSSRPYNDGPDFWETERESVP